MFDGGSKKISINKPYYMKFWPCWKLTCFGSKIRVYFPQVRVQVTMWPAVQAYFGWTKPCSCSCSYCCSRHLWFCEIGEYPSGRCEGERRKGGRGRGEKIYSSPLSPRRFPASSPLPLSRPILPLFGKFQHGAFASKNICAPEENACTAG